MTLGRCPRRVSSLRVSTLSLVSSLQPFSPRINPDIFSPRINPDSARMNPESLPVSTLSLQKNEHARVLFRAVGRYHTSHLLQTVANTHLEGSRTLCVPQQLLHINVQRFQGGLVLEAHRLCVSLNSRLESNKEEEDEVCLHRRSSTGEGGTSLLFFTTPKPRVE